MERHLYRHQPADPRRQAEPPAEPRDVVDGAHGERRCIQDAQGDAQCTVPHDRRPVGGAGDGVRAARRGDGQDGGRVGPREGVDVAKLFVVHVNVRVLVAHRHAEVERVREASPESRRCND